MLPCVKNVEVEGIEPSPRQGPKSARRTTPPWTASLGLTPELAVLFAIQAKLCNLACLYVNAILHLCQRTLSMKFWRFYDYCSPAGNNLIEEWYADQGAEVQAVFDATLNNLAGLRSWHDRSDFSMLHGRHAGLGEIRFKVANVQYRPVGFFGQERNTFVLLICASKKQRIYKPPDAFDLAVTRKKLLDQNAARFEERDLV